LIACGRVREWSPKRTCIKRHANRGGFGEACPFRACCAACGRTFGNRRSMNLVQRVAPSMRSREADIENGFRRQVLSNNESSVRASL
jgi:hypothetical protein